MARRQYIVTNPSDDSGLDFTKQPDLFKKFVLDSMKEEGRVLKLNAKLAAHSGEQHPDESFEFTVHELFATVDEFRRHAQDKLTSKWVMIEINKDEVTFWL